MELVCILKDVRGKGVESTVSIPRKSLEINSGVLSGQPVSIASRGDLRVSPFSLNTACFLGYNKYNILKLIEVFLIC